MKYKTYVNGIQIFGDNDCYEEWLSFLKSQGIGINEDNSYEGDITDFMGAVETIEAIVMRLYREREDLRAKDPETKKRSLFDLSHMALRLENQGKKSERFQRYSMSLLDLLIQAADQAYCFFPYSFYMACKNVLEQDEPYTRFGHFRCWHVKDGMKIHVMAAHMPPVKHILPLQNIGKITDVV